MCEGGGGGGGVEGFINSAAAVIELFVLSILNLKHYFKKISIPELQLPVIYVIQNYCLCNAPSHPPTCTKEK